MSAARQQQQEEPQSGGLVIFEGYTGLNTQASRIGIQDTQGTIFDGWFPFGNDNARVIPDLGPSIFTPSGTEMVAFYAFGNISVAPYCIVLTSDGAVWSVNTNTLVQNAIAPVGTIQTPGPLTVGLSQYGSQYIIIVSNQPNGYFVWDGTTFYSAGQTVPGMGTMPTGVSGTAVAVFSAHVWVANGNVLSFSAPESVTDFSTADGGGNLTFTDSTLRVACTAMVSTNGYLYLIGDSDIQYISNVQTTGSPATTSFTLQNSDPEIGSPWPTTVDTVGSNIVMANPWGAHVSYGGRTAKISADLDGIYNTADNFGGGIPSAAKAILFGKRVWILLLPVIDSYTGQQVNKLFLWDEKRWCSTQQSKALSFINGQEINSVLTAYGSDNFGIYPLFAAPSVNFQKVLQSKFWIVPRGDAVSNAVSRLWAVVQLYSNLGATLSISSDSENGSSVVQVTPEATQTTWLNNSAATVTWQNSGAEDVTWESGGNNIVVIPPQKCGQWGVLIGFTVTTNAADLALLSLATQPIPTQFRG